MLLPHKPRDLTQNLSHLPWKEHPSPQYLHFQIRINWGVNSSPWFLGLYMTVTDKNSTILSLSAYSVNTDVFQGAGTTTKQTWPHCYTGFELPSLLRPQPGTKRAITGWGLGRVHFVQLCLDERPREAGLLTALDSNTLLGCRQISQRGHSSNITVSLFTITKGHPHIPHLGGKSKSHLY